MDPELKSDRTLSMVIDHAIYPVTEELLHQLFDRYGVEQLVVYPPIVSDGEPCVAADVRFSSANAAAQAYAYWDGRCIYYRCCRLQMWIASADVLPAQPSAAATPATDAVLHEGGDDCFNHCIDTSDCFIAPETVSSGVTELVTVSAREIGRASCRDRVFAVV